MGQQVYNTAGNFLFMPGSVGLVAGNLIKIASTGGGKGGSNGVAGTGAAAGNGGIGGTGGSYVEGDNYALLATDVASGISVNIPAAAGPATGGGNVTVSNLFLASFTINSAGTGYLVGDVFTINTSSGCIIQPQLTVTSVNGSGGVTGLSISRPGIYSSNFPGNPPFFTGGTGTGINLSIFSSGPSAVLFIQAAGGGGSSSGGTFTNAGGAAGTGGSHVGGTAGGGGGGGAAGGPSGNGTAGSNASGATGGNGGSGAASGGGAGGGGGNGPAGNGTAGTAPGGGGGGGAGGPISSSGGTGGNGGLGQVTITWTVTASLLPLQAINASYGVWKHFDGDKGWDLRP
jgi:hypothetical protein